MDISCPVSCKFPHGTLHYQSRTFSSFLVGGSTFFNPYFMYKFTRKSRQVFCTGGMCFSPQPFRISEDATLFPPSNLFSLLISSNLPGLTQNASHTNFARHYFRSLCWFLFLGTKMFQFPSFSSLSYVCFRMYGIQYSFFGCFHTPYTGLSQC